MPRKRVAVRTGIARDESPGFAVFRSLHLSHRIISLARRARMTWRRELSERECALDTALANMSSIE